LLAKPVSIASSAPSGGVSQQPKAGGADVATASRLRLRFSIWQNRLPVDALPVEGWIELILASEAELMAAM
jgi:hypothetical protein